MAAVYESMAATFVRDGLNLAAIVAIRQFYGDLDADPEPLYYEHFPTPLQQGAVRLVVFKPKPTTLEPMHQDPLLHLTHEACQDILASAPSGMYPRMCFTSCVPANGQDLAMCVPQCTNARSVWLVWNSQSIVQQLAQACPHSQRSLPCGIDRQPATPAAIMCNPCMPWMRQAQLATR